MEGEGETLNQQDGAEKINPLGMEKWSQILQSEDGVREAIPTAEYIVKSVQWSDLYDIITAVTNVSGWKGNDSRNPMPKVFLGLLTKAMANGVAHGNNTGMSTEYLKWAIEDLSEKNTKTLATECLLSTCYQYSPKMVLSVLEQILFQTERDRVFLLFHGLVHRDHQDFNQLIPDDVVMILSTFASLRPLSSPYGHYGM